MSAKDDQRLQELANRLVQMSPEPPEFPVEEIAARPVGPARRLSPLLVFAGTLTLVAIGVVVPFILMHGPVGSDTAITLDPPTIESTVPVETSVPVATTVPSPQTTEETTVELLVFDTVVFLVSEPANSYSGNPTLVPFHTTVAGDKNTNLALATLQLLANPDQEVEPPPGFWDAIPPGVEVYGATLETDGAESVLVVEVNDEFRKGAGGLLADVTMLNQFVYTATALGGADSVRFTIGGSPIDAFGSEGLVLTDPVARNDYLDFLNSIVITEPFVLGGDELSVVSGIANVYEATVSLQLVWPDSGEVAYEDFTTASCGTGCWGEFSFSLDTSQLEPGQVLRVFWNSPQDGSPSDVVTYPVGPEGEPWDLFPLDPG